MKKILTVAMSIALAIHYSFAKGGSSGGSSSRSSSSSSYKSSSSSFYGSSSSYKSSSLGSSFSSFKESSDGSNSSNSGVKSSAKADVKTPNLSNLSDKKTKTVESKKVDKDNIKNSKNSKKSKDDSTTDLLNWFIFYQIWMSGGSHERRSGDYGSSYTPPPSPNTDNEEIKKLYNIYTKVCSNVGFGKEKTYRITKLERTLSMNRKDVVENLRKVEDASDGLFIVKIMGNKVKVRCNKAKESDIKKVEKMNRR